MIAPPRGCRPGRTVRPLETDGLRQAADRCGRAARLLIAADLPRQGRFTRTIAAGGRSHRPRAARPRLPRRAASGSRCRSATTRWRNPAVPKRPSARPTRHAYAANPAVIGVVGPIHSFCAAAMLPILNRAARRARLRRLADQLLRLADASRPRGPSGIICASSIRPASAATRVSTRPTTLCWPRPWSPSRQLGATSVFYLYDRGGQAVAALLPRRRPPQLTCGSGRCSAGIADAANFRALARRVRDVGSAGRRRWTAACTSTSGACCATSAAARTDFPILATEDALPITQLFDEAGAGRARRPHRARRHGSRSGWTPPAGASCASSARRQPGGRVGQFDVYAAAATEVLLDAIARSDGTRESVASALSTTRLAASPIGPITLDRRGDPTVTHVTVIRARARRRAELRRRRRGRRDRARDHAPRRRVTDPAFVRLLGICSS